MQNDSSLRREPRERSGLKPQESPPRVAALPPLDSEVPEIKPAEITIAFPDNAAAYANGNQVVIKGPREASEQARRVFELLYERVKKGQPASEGDVQGAIAESAYQGLLFPGEEGAKEGFGTIKTRKRGVVRARSAAVDPHRMSRARHRARTCAR